MPPKKKRKAHGYCPNCQKTRPISQFESTNGLTININCRTCMNRAAYPSFTSTSASVQSIMERKTTIHVVQARSNVLSGIGNQHHRVRYAKHPDNGFLHMSGTGYTDKRDYAWVGLVSQFETLCNRLNIDATEYELPYMKFFKKTAILTIDDERVEQNETK